MLLRKIEIYGFKSFADRIHMKFDKGITAIVGPNGSGKSNVADAVRWVLGEQSAKSLRGSRMEDIIFSGTQVRKPLGFAEVSLTFDNTCGTLPLEYSEVTITRRVFRSGDSEYYINRGACRLKDIVELFMDTGVGKEGYSIIGQGRIDEILSTRSEERRYIFEEAAGIVKYKSRKEEAEKKLEKTKNNLIRVDDILSELQEQLVPLEDQASKAREYLSYKEKLKVLEINQFINQFDKHNLRIKALKEQIAALEIDINAYNKNNEAKEMEKNAAGIRLNDLLNAIDNQKNERHELLNSIEHIKGKLSVLSERLNQYARDNARLSAEIEEISSDKKVKEHRFYTLTQSLTEKEAVLLKNKSELEKIIAAYNDVDKELELRQSKVDESRSSIIDIMNRISEINNHIVRFRTMITAFDERLDAIDKAITNLIGRREEHEKSVDQLKKGMDENALLYSSLADQKQMLSDLMLQQKQEISLLESNMQKNKQLREGCSSRLSLMEDMKKGYEGFHKSVKAVLAACRQNNITGKNVHGVVADLIKVPKEYELAIETALGQSLQHIVTETEEDAKHLIEFLRNNRLGRATFLPVSSISGRYLNQKEMQVISLNGCRGVASQLIDFDKKYKNIVDNLLGRVIIAENIDVAIPMARKYSYGFRIVTLEGDVLNPGGSMTGGSTQSKSISILSRNRQIKELSNEIQELDNRLSESNYKLTSIRTEYESNKGRLELLNKEIQEVELTSRKLKDNLSRLNMQKEQMEREEQELAAERSQIDDNLVKLNERINKEEAVLKEYELKKISISDNASESEIVIRNISAEKDRLSSIISDRRVETAALEGELKSTKEEIANTRNEIERYIFNIKSKDDQIRENTDSIESLKLEQAKEEAAIKETERLVAIAEKGIEQKESSRKEQEKAIYEIEAELKALSQTLNELNNNKHSFEVQLSRLETELENYQNNIWEEYALTYAGALNYADPEIDIARANQSIKQLKEQIAKLGDVNVNAIEEYKRVSERNTFLTEQRKDLLNAKENLNGIIEDITQTMKQRFKTEFAVINSHFSDIFKKLFNGGHAQLVLEDDGDILSCGIDIIAQPPGKKLQSLSLLSGGEKAMTAIAILFAILKHKPTPFCVLDEIDAALDESNVSHFSSFVNEFSKDTQFIIITHRKGTMEVCDILYGISMEEKGVSKLISAKLEENAS